MHERIDDLKKCVGIMGLLCGFGKSESGSERFTNLFLGAIEKASDEVEMSREEGLCLDLFTSLAIELELLTRELKEEANDV